MTRTLSKSLKGLKLPGERVVIGSLALKEPILIRRWMDDLGPEKIVLALDVKMNADGVPYPTSHGWKETGEKSLWQLLNEYEFTVDEAIAC